MIPEKAIEQLRESTRFIFVGDGGIENPTLVFGAVASSNVDLIYLLLRGASEAPQIAQAIIDAAKCLQGSSSNEILKMINQVHAAGEREDL